MRCDVYCDAMRVAMRHVLRGRRSVLTKDDVIYTAKLTEELHYYKDDIIGVASI